MSFLYPRTITISRASDQYSAAAGLHVAQTTIASGVPAAIQPKRIRVPAPIAYPSPTNTDGAMSEWRILIPNPAPSVLKADMVTDDLGNQYEIVTAYPNGLGMQCDARIYAP